MPLIGLILLILLIAFPLIEIAVLIKVGSIIGFWSTFAIIAVTFVLGMTVVQHQGPGVARRFVETARTGEPPVEPMMEAMLLMFAGGCLIAPGLITDCIGLLLLIPPLRQWAARLAIAKAFPLANSLRRDRSQDGSKPGNTGPTRRSSASAPTIEADYERIDERPMGPRRPPSGDH